MGDKEGAKEILREVIQEGDDEQKAQAKALLDSLG
jgi:pilus assembly protein FimV